MKEKIFTLKMNGYCCSQIVMQVGLEQMGKENEDMVEAVAGLCDGAKRGSICGAASAAVCLLYLADGKLAERELIQEYYDWFEDAFGSLECDEILDNDPMAKLEKCPLIVEDTLLKLTELLEWD